MGGRMKGERKSAYLGGREGVVETFQLSAYIWRERGGAEHLSLTYRAHSQHTKSNCNPWPPPTLFPFLFLLLFQKKKGKKKRKEKKKSNMGLVCFKIEWKWWIGVGGDLPLGLGLSPLVENNARISRVGEMVTNSTKKQTLSFLFLYFCFKIYVKSEKKNKT